MLDRPAWQQAAPPMVGSTRRCTASRASCTGAQEGFRHLQRHRVLLHTCVPNGRRSSSGPVNLPAPARHARRRAPTQAPMEPPIRRTRCRGDNWRSRTGPRLFVARLFAGFCSAQMPDGLCTSCPEVAKLQHLRRRALAPASTKTSFVQERYAHVTVRTSDRPQDTFQFGAVLKPDLTPHAPSGCSRALQVPEL